MVHKDHVWLIQKAVGSGGIWADLGSGTGAFTLALRDVAGETVQIYSVDQDGDSLHEQQRKFDAQFPHTNITYLNQSYTDQLNLPLLDGIIMANSLHYVQNQSEILKKLRMYLKPQGTFILVEYNATTGNHWVPYPIAFEKFESLAAEAGFEHPELLERIPSQFLREIYSAVTKKL